MRTGLSRSILFVFALMTVFGLWSSQRVAADAGPSPFNVAEARRSVVFITRVTPRISSSLGSGFIVDQSGLIYTNRHVVEPQDPKMKGTRLFVGVPSEADPDDLDYFEAKLVYAPPPQSTLDFAVLKIAAGPDYQRLRALPLSFDNKVKLGSEVVIIGYPLGLADLPVLSFNKGNISATRAVIRGKSFYQIDAAINPGNSGGPLLDENGRVIGIVTSKLLGRSLMNYALQLHEIKERIAVARERSKKVTATPGPFGNRLPAAPRIDLNKSAWRMDHAVVHTDDRGTKVENGEKPYWISTRQLLPKNFQCTIYGRIELLNLAQLPRGGLDAIRNFCVRFGTPDVQSSILVNKGYYLRYSAAYMVLAKNGKTERVVREGNSAGDMALTITKQGQNITVAVGQKIWIEYRDSDPLIGRHPLSIGGTKSKLHLYEVSLVDLDAKEDVFTTPAAKGP